MKNIDEIKLENYEFSPRTIRIDDEDIMLFSVMGDSENKRTKKDADNIGIELVKRWNENAQLKQQLSSLYTQLNSAADLEGLRMQENEALKADNERLRETLISIFDTLEHGSPEQAKVLAALQNK